MVPPAAFVPFTANNKSVPEGGESLQPAGTPEESAGVEGADVALINTIFTLAPVNPVAPLSDLENVCFFNTVCIFSIFIE